jgi:hypothetical protein
MEASTKCLQDVDELGREDPNKLEIKDDDDEMPPLLEDDDVDGKSILPAQSLFLTCLFLFRLQRRVEVCRSAQLTPY